jgi:CHAT domain-containing protein
VDRTDQVTAELMVQGAAQIELIREPIRITTAHGQALETDAASPYLWAAFQVFGDWR